MNDPALQRDWEMFVAAKGRRERNKMTDHVKADAPPDAQFELRAYAHGCATNPEVTEVVLQQAVDFGDGEVVIIRSYISPETARVLARGLSERADIVDGLRDDVTD